LPELEEKTEKPVSFKLDPDLVRQIDEISERDHRSRTGTVKLALEAFIESRKPSKAGRA
jgi:predicted transcriptional regulator